MCVRVVLLALALLAGPATYTHAQTQQAATQFSPDVPLQVLQSLAYVDIEKGRALSFIDGVYRDERRSMRLLDASIAYGDLDHDGTRDAVVLLEERTRETTILHLAAVVQRAGRVRNMASWRLGEHAQVKSIAIDNGVVMLSLLAMGEGDVPAKPTVKMLLGLKLAGSEIQLMRREPKGRLAATLP
jgi:hypothetical protein